MPGLWQPRVISFGSGGVRIIGHLGTLAALTESGLTGCVREWYGCSGGALCALAGALGVSAAWLRDLVGHLDLRPMGHFDGEPLDTLYESWGITRGTLLFDMLERFFETWEPGISRWSFADFARARPGVRLGITATNVSRGQLTLFSSETTPTLRIMDAIRASAAIPMYFTPWRAENGDLFCDGALIEEYPWSSIMDREGTLVIICSRSSIKTEIPALNGLMDYFTQLMRIGRRQLHKDLTEEYPRYWIAVNNQTVSVLDYELDAAGRMELFQEGVVAGQRWMAFRSRAGAPTPAPAAPSGTAGTPPPFADPDSAGRDHDGGSRRLDSHPPRTADETCPSRRPDTGARHRDRRWSL